MWRMRFLCAAVLVWWTVGAAQAHFIWIEHDGDGVVRAYFGEWAEEVREKTGESRGEAYNRLRHVSTLSFVAEEGIAWITQ
jgi:hypothetical protein